MTRLLAGLPREVTLLIIEHDMDVVCSLADRVTVLHYGEVLTEGTFAEVKADPRVYEVYLGDCLTRSVIAGPMLRACDGIHTYYGESHVLHGVSLRVGARRGGGAARPQRRGQDHADPQHRGLHAAARGPRALRGASRSSGWPAHRIARRGIALVPQGRRIFAPLTVRENLSLGARAAGWTLERVFELFPRLRERAGPGGRHAVGRRAADAGHRPRAPDQRPPAAAGRAVGGPGAR